MRECGTYGSVKGKRLSLHDYKILKGDVEFVYSAVVMDMDRFLLNRSSMTIPSDGLVEALEARIATKNTVLQDRDARLGKNRIRISSYLENISLPELFDFDMNMFFRDPELAMEIALRSKIFWLDNSHDDQNADLTMAATAGMYFDMTLFGLGVTHTTQGVPEFMPHPIANKADISLIGTFDFHTTGEMPNLLRQYDSLREISSKRYDNKIKVMFPSFHRGPLDIYIQMRGYYSFIEDILENPQFTRDFLSHIVNERIRWNIERALFLGEELPARNTFIADDWVNMPFITPCMFDDFIIPAYKKIQDAEGKVNGFHTCGVMGLLAGRLLQVFPDIGTLDVSGWNDFSALDAMIDPSVSFGLNFINTFVLVSLVEEHRKMLENIYRIARHRKISLCAQAIVRVHDTFDETIARMNRFIDLAHDMLR